MPALFIKTLVIGGLVFLTLSVAAEDMDSARAQALVFNCFTCHGPDGSGPGAMKSLRDMTAAEIRDELMAFRRDENDPTIMNRIAKGYTDEEIDLIARYLAGHLAGEKP